MIQALARLRHRSQVLTTRLAFGTATEVAAARELLRQSLIELYEYGHWRDQPEQFKTYMRLYRACDPSSFSVQESSSAPDKRVRYSL